jgi:hypothetical protein
MAVKDSPDTKVKALDAKIVMEATRRGLGPDSLNALRARKSLRACFAYYLAFDTDPRAIVSADIVDQAVLDDWTRNAVARIKAKPSEGVVIIAIRADGWIDVATWGRTQADCGLTGALGAAMLKNLPACPFQTWFGWGNQGLPKALSDAQVATLNETAQAYVSRNTHPTAM